MDHKNGVYSWGMNNFGQLAEDAKVVPESCLPREIRFFIGKSAVQVFAGEYCSTVVTKANLIFAWGCVFLLLLLYF